MSPPSPPPALYAPDAETAVRSVRHSFWNLPRIAALGVVHLVLLCLASVLSPPGPLPAQTAPSGDWNAPRALELVDRGREARRALQEDPELRSYRAETRGNVYFYIDPEEGEDRPLLRVDQVAVDLYWMAPGLTQQVIVGHQEEKLLPIRDFQYFLDRLTLVQYGFGDRIQVGEGMDVRDVPHPLAPPEAQVGGYDFRLSDSVTVTLPPEPDDPTPRSIRVYELEVRPADPDNPGVVGTLRLDRESGALVRMDFTFTPSSYVDPRNDQVQVALEYGLWQGRHWLPHEQRVEVRREIPQLDLGVGTIILAVLRTGGYEFNVPLDQEAFRGPRVTRAPPEELEAFPFPEAPLDAVRSGDLPSSVGRMDPGEIRRRGRELLEQSHPSGLPPVRLHVPDVSSVLRFNRAEGWRVGSGLGLRPHPALDVRITGGYAFGSRDPSLGVRGRMPLRSGLTLEVEGTLAQLRDIGPHPGSDGLTNTLAAVTRGADYLDPYLTHRAQVGIRAHPGQAWTVGAALHAEWASSLPLTQERAPLDGGRAFRPVREVDSGLLASVRGEVGWEDPYRRPGHRRFQGSLEVGSLREGGEFARLLLSARLRGWEGRPGTGLTGSVRGGATLGTSPLQRLTLLGGRHTLPGHPYRGFAGEHHIQSSLEGAVDAHVPWLRLRGGLWAGWTEAADGRIPSNWNAQVTDGVRLGATIGAGFFYDLLRLEGARGYPDGEWQLLFSVDPRWWDRL